MNTVIQLAEISGDQKKYQVYRYQMRGGRRIDVCLISLLLLVLGKTTMNFTHLW